MNTLITAIAKAQKMVVFTGAGVSTLSGLPDFRGKSGLYTKYDADKIFNLEYFYKDPGYYYANAKELIYSDREIQPNIVHTECARLEQAGKVKGVITQNIDMLHQKAGSHMVYEIHGSPWHHHCLSCGKEYTYEWIREQVQNDMVPRCACRGLIKPDITFFGEMLPEETLEQAIDLAGKADLMLVVGTSLVVQPAASIPFYTLDNGGKMIIINDGFTPLDHFSTQRYTDIATCFKAIAAIA